MDAAMSRFKIKPFFKAMAIINTDTPPSPPPPPKNKKTRLKSH